MAIWPTHRVKAQDQKRRWKAAKIRRKYERRGIMPKVRKPKVHEPQQIQWDDL